MKVPKLSKAAKWKILVCFLALGSLLGIGWGIWYVLELNIIPSFWELALYGIGGGMFVGVCWFLWICFKNGIFNPFGYK